MAETLDISGLIDAGWVYRDTVKWASATMWDQCLAVIGDENVHVLAATEKTDAAGTWRRGQLLISPAGIENLKSFTYGGRQ